MQSAVSSAAKDSTDRRSGPRGGGGGRVALFPDSDRTRVIFQSAAEEKFYRTCLKDLQAPWRVYYSVTLSTQEEGKGQRGGEMDFVLYHPDLGCVVVEVKGGRIKYDQGRGQFSSVNRHGEEFEIKNPFNQALIWKSRFVRFLRRNHVRVPVSHAVCFPSVAEREIPETAERTPGLIIGRERLRCLDKSLRRIVRGAQPEEYLRFGDCAAELDKLLVGDSFMTKLYLRDYMDSNELRVKDFEVIQQSLITPIAGSQRLAIEGEAGTGKTTLAVMLSRRFRDQGARVLLLSSNPLLSLYLEAEVGKGVTVQTYAGLGTAHGIDLLTPAADFEGTRDDWAQYEAPERLRKKLSESSERYDVVICDEAQDVQPFWWDGVEALLCGDDARFYIFFDQSQGVFGSGGRDAKFVPEEVLPIAGPYFPLVHNYRTTREITSFSRSFRTGRQILHSHCGRIGYVPELIVYDDAEDCRRKLARLSRRLIRDEELRPEEITVLSARDPGAKQSVLHRTTELAQTPLFSLSAKSSSTRVKDSITVATIPSFKGLETEVAILVNVSEHKLPLDNPIMSSLMYVAFTRAKHMLYVMVQRDDPKRPVFQRALHQVNASGPMVVEGSHANFEFCGTVVHYNPERVGWLRVEDPAFSKNRIMFFPNDVKRSDLHGVGVGSKLRFVPRVEGDITIAADLRIAS